MSTVIDALASSSAPAAARNGGVQTGGDAASADRFLKLLVTQMQNQDPLNPMDNAQITSQMAQINTVSGIEKLNGAVEGLNRQFMQLQALQGAALVGRDITLQGDRLVVQGGRAVGGFELDGAADRVKVEVLNGAGRVVDTLDLGAQDRGRHGFEWAAASAADGDAFRFRVVANAGAALVKHTPLMRDRVEAVSLDGDRLTLETRHSGDIDYAAVKAVN
jgi:flagellar basal-body rod modification protein FlgD